MILKISILKGKMIFFAGILLIISCFQFAFTLSKAKKPTPFKLDYPAYFGGRFSIPDENPMTEEGIKLGRMLFYETKLSANNQISCGSCHQQKLAFTDGQQFSTGVDGSLTKRNSMSLANLLWVRNFFWDGRVKSLEDQAVVPLTDPHEMGQSMAKSIEKLNATADYQEHFSNAFGSAELTEERIIKAIAQFERTLISANSPYDHYLKGAINLSEQELRGMELFMNGPSPQNQVRGANCGHCHGTPKMFKELFHNNGLDNLPQDPGRMAFTGQESDRGRFRVPTLRNISVTAPYMHDGRFQTLEEVLDHYNEHIQPNETLSPFLTNISNEVGRKTLMLTSDEKRAIIAFLQTLTDSTFLNRLDYSDPNTETLHLNQF